MFAHRDTSSSRTDTQARDSAFRAYLNPCETAETADAIRQLEKTLMALTLLIRRVSLLLLTDSNEQDGEQLQEILSYFCITNEITDSP